MPDGFEASQVWQMAHALRLVVHKRIAPALPRHERWDLARQIRHSAKSIGANIADGYGRYYYQDNVRFCYNARGSLLETIDHLVAARDLDYIDLSLYKEARELADSNYRRLNGYIAFLKKRKFGADEPGAAILLAHRRDNASSDPEPEHALRAASPTKADRSTD